MNKNLKAIEQLCQISDAIIGRPSLSLKDFGIEKIRRQTPCSIQVTFQLVQKFLLQA